MEQTKTALITGGSRGLGLALAKELSATGWRVIVTGRREADLRAAADEIGGDVVSVAGDVTDPHHRADLRSAAGDRLDLLINNASELGSSPLRPLVETTPEEFRHVLDVNVVAPAALVAEVLPILSTEAVVVNISSDAAVEAYPSWGSYGASKAALDHLTRTLAAEHPALAVYSFDPGDMRTDMHQAAFPGEDISDRPDPASVVPVLVRLVSERPPSGRYEAALLRAGVAR